MPHTQSEQVVSASLVKGYVARGDKYSWGNLVSYGNDVLYQSLDAAKVAVERQRGWGIMWTIAQVPACIARGTNSALVFCVCSRCAQLPDLRSEAHPRLCYLLPQSEASRPRSIVAADSQWEPCEPPFRSWYAESVGGSSPLMWRESPINAAVRARDGAVEWLAKLQARVRSSQPIETPRGGGP